MRQAAGTHFSSEANNSIILNTVARIFTIIARFRR